jgi:hypothetical protein
MSWVAVAIGGGAVIGGAANIFGANSQQQTNNANLQAQQQQANYMRQMVGQYLQPGNAQNPYAAQMMQFLGGQRSPGQPPIQQPFSTQQFYGDLPQIGRTPDAQLGDAQFVDQTPVNIQAIAQSFNPSGAINLGGQQTPWNQYGGPAAYANIPQPNALGSAYQFRPQDNGMYNYNPAQLGSAPQVTAPQMGGLGQLSAQQMGQLPQFMPQQVGTPASVAAPQIQMPGGIDLPQIGMPAVVGTQGSNAGQDGLLQMMRRDVSAPRDASIDPMLQSGTQQFDNSALFRALAPQDNQLLDEQVNQLRGSAGSFGQRFGSEMIKREGNMRQTFANNIAARNAGIQQQSFEAAQGRNLQGAGIQSGREQFFGQIPFQNAQLQQQAAGQAGQLGQANQGLNLQAQQFNVGQNQNAQQFNAQNAIQASLASQGIAAQIGQANASNALQAGQFNAGQQQQANLANQSAGLQAGMQGQQLSLQQMLAQAQMNQQAGQFNIGNQLNMMQGNQQSALQALLANQGLQGQYGLANMQAMNQGGQFNAGMNMQNQQFNAQQGNIYNQLMMSGMMNAAGLQNQQQSQNISLLGLLGGIGVPQQQVNPMYGAIGNAAQNLGSLPMMMSLMNGFGGSGGGASNYNPNYSPYTLPPNLQSLYGGR